MMVAVCGACDACCVIRFGGVCVCMYCVSLCVCVLAGLRLVFIDGNHFYQGVSEDFVALESQGDLFMFHDIASTQFVEHTKKLFDEVAAKPAFECRSFVDNYPTGRVGFGIGVCVRRVFMSGLVAGGVTPTLPAAVGGAGGVAAPTATTPVGPGSSTGACVWVRCGRDGP